MGDTFMVSSFIGATDKSIMNVEVDYNKVVVNCTVCGKEFNISPSRYSENGNCCSKNCLTEKQKSTNNVKCYICGKPFHVKPSYLNRMKHPERICCSRECSSKERSERLTGDGNHQWGVKGDLNSSHKSDIKITNYGYIKVRNLTHPYRDSEDFVLLHRLVYEEYLKDIKSFDFLEYNNDINDYVLSKNVIVHHIDGNKLNNTHDNLQAMFLGEHVSLHNTDNPRDRDDISQRFISSGKKSSGKLIKKHNLDAGLDVYSSEECVIPPNSSRIISTGLRVAIPEGCVGLLWSRSGLSAKHNLEVGAGCIDAGYTGEVKVHLYNYGDNEYKVSVDDRIAQLLTIPINLNNYIDVDELPDTSRGDNGHGSTGV